MLDFRSTRPWLTLAAAAGLAAQLAVGCDDGRSVANDGATCSELGPQARSEGFDALAAADRSCSEDSQCVVTYQHPRCTDACGYQAAIDVAAVTDVQSEMLRIESDYCEDFERQSCTLLALPCTPTDTQQPVCRDGQCELIPE